MTATFVMEFPELGRLRATAKKRPVVVQPSVEMEEMTLGELLYVALMEKADAVKMQS